MHSHHFSLICTLSHQRAELSTTNKNNNNNNTTDINNNNNRHSR